ncbi:adenylate cyclase [Flavobacterium sp. PL11]|jgi:adenylate cyclase|uniref:CYTH domain-containing protein n=1 Tax=Flavobacterium sp. PL11 TaxID=3071717 RepID=UPI002E0A8C0A|nr:adenylate cyclase [Flavobacterium sp. PL11]
MIEIERKFLVKNDSYKSLSFSRSIIAQGYLSSVPERTVRIRIKGDDAFLTIKGASNDSGLSRFEWENELSIDDAKKLLLLCETGIIEKTRYEVQSGEHVFEVDEFHGENMGLCIAEIELKSEEEVFIKPSWVGDEMTGNIKYYNAYLSKNPFRLW